MHERAGGFGAAKGPSEDEHRERQENCGEKKQNDQRLKDAMQVCAT